MIDLSRVSISDDCSVYGYEVHDLNYLDVGYDYTKPLEYDSLEYYVSSTLNSFGITIRSNGKNSDDNVLKSGILYNDMFTVLDFPVSVYLIEFHGRQVNSVGSYATISEHHPVFMEHSNDNTLSIYHNGECFLVDGVDMLDRYDVLDYLKKTKKLIINY